MPEGDLSLPKSGYQRKEPRNFSQETCMKTLIFNLITKVVSMFSFFVRNDIKFVDNVYATNGCL